MTAASDDPYSIPVLSQNVTLPEFAFFQVVKVKLTGEAAIITGMKYTASNQQTEDKNEEWLYLLDGLTHFGAVWWKVDQLRSLDLL